MYFRRSTRKDKKYDAVLDDGKIIPFGQIGYEHYRDKTPLKLYSHLDHNDFRRRMLFRERFEKLYKANENNLHSAIYWSWNYLW